MKKILIALIIGYSFFSITCLAQTYGWMDISGNIPDFPYDTTIINNGQDTLLANLSDLYFINDNEGWITSWHPFNDTAAVLHTTDGGESFQVQITPFPCEAIWMLNENEGYAGGQSGFIYRTTNGGDKWIFHGTITTTLSDITFPPQPADTGYACGDNGKIYKVHSFGVISMTSNVGTTNMTSITFPTAEEGWSCGGQVIIHYIGGTWNGDQTYTSGWYSDVYFVNNTQGWAVGNKIIHTLDGQNWITQVNHDSLISGLWDIFFLNENEGWFVGNIGQIQHTTNGGDSWTREFENYTNTFLTAVQFTISNNGYISGNEKTLLKYGEITSVKNGEDLPTEYSLSQNYPNPFNPTTTIKYQIPELSFITLKLFDVLGSEIATLVNEEKPIGNYEVEFNGSKLTSGIYFYRLQAGNFIETKKMVLVK